MKILMVNDHRPEEVLGGTERYILDVIATLEDKGHEVHLFGMSDTGSETRPMRRIFCVQTGGFLARYLKGTLFYPALYRALREYVREVQPDVVHLHNSYRCPITVNLALRGHRVVQTVHDYTALYPTALCVREQSCAGRPPWVAIRHGCLDWKVVLAVGWLLYNRRFLDRRIVDCFVAPSRNLAEHLWKRGYRNVHHLPNFTSAPISPETPLEDKPVVLYVGSLTRHKGIDVLLRAFSRVVDEFEDAALWLVGSGPDEDRLRSITAELSLASVRFWGRHDHEELGRFYDSARVVVIPSLWLENAPLVAYEAMAHRRPIVASAVGGLPELVRHGENGHIFERGNVAELEKSLRCLLDEPELARQLGLNGTRHLMTFDDRLTHVDRLLAIYGGVSKADSAPRTATEREH